MKTTQKRAERVELAVVGFATMTMVCFTVVNFKASVDRDLSDFNAICLSVFTGCIAFLRGGDLADYLSNNRTEPPRTTVRRQVWIDEPESAITKKQRYVDEEI